MEKIIRWGIIGCGNVTEIKSGPAFNKVGNAVLNAVMRRTEEKAKDYAQRHGIPHYYSKAEDLILSPDIDAVYVATPPSSHAQYAIMAMEAGKPVYVEKPMATRYADCVEMNKVSDKTGMLLGVAYYRRTLPGFLKVKELLDAKAIGIPLAVNIKLTRPVLESEKNTNPPAWRVNKKIAGGGIFVDLASHQFDYLDFIMGPVVKVYGITSNNNPWYSVEDTVTASFQFANGVMGAGVWSFMTNNNVRQDNMEIIGTEGTILFSTFNPIPIKLITHSECVEFPYTNPENIQYNLIKQMNEAIINKTECVSNGISAARTNKVLEAIVQSP